MIRNIDFEEDPNTSLRLRHNILAFQVDGKLDGESFKALVNRLSNELESPEHIKLYIKISSMNGMEPEVIWDSLKFSVKYLKAYLKQIDKVAVVTDSVWITRATKIEAKLLPNIEERAFPLNESEKALDWLKAA